VENQAMGIFDVFNKISAVPRTDLVWITSAAKQKGALDYLTKNRPDLCLAWFEQTQRTFNRHLNEENHMNIEIKLAGSMRLFDLNKKTAVFLEHYPVYSKEANLLSEYRPDHVCFLNSLDDSIFQLFGGNVASLMRGLGLGEDEYIENDMVGNAVMKAQKKLEKKFRDDFYARSGEEWMEMYRTYHQRLR
jgi:hypothetical protein